VLIEHGRLVERGSHGALTARSERYRRLVDAYERAAAARAEALDDDSEQVPA